MVQSAKISTADFREVLIMAKDPGDKLRSALKLKISGAPSSFSNQIGGSDRSDLLRITLGRLSSLNVTMTGLKANADLRLFDNSGKKVLAQSRLTGKQSEAINTSLEAGTYYFKVSAGSRRSRTPYQLIFAVTEIVPAISTTTASTLIPPPNPPSSSTADSRSSDISSIPLTAKAEVAGSSLDISSLMLTGRLVIGTYGNDFGINALFGTSGSDQLYGFTGYDELYGGAGADLFGLTEQSLGYFYPGDSYAVIRDFSVTDGDVIQLKRDSYFLATDVWTTVFGTIFGTVIYSGTAPIAVVQNASLSDVNSRILFV